MLTAPKSQPRILPPQGTHKARCIELIQIGTIKTTWQGEDKWLEKIRIKFELPEKLHVFKEGEPAKPFVVSGKYTLSMGSKSNLYPIVEGIVGYIPEEVRESFDVEDLVGKACLISIKHESDGKGNTYANIKGTSELMEGMTIPEAINTPRILTYEKWDKDFFNSLPDFIKEEMQGSKQYQDKFVSKDERTTEELDANDVPF